MKLITLALAVAALSLMQPVQAQRAPQPTAQPRVVPDASRQLALASRAADAPAKPARLACAPLGGKVYDPNGRPLMGATLLIKGTQKVYVTDTTGHFRFTAPVYEGQVLTVQAAGFRLREVPLNDCALPRLVLERNPEAHLRRSGKRAGQVTRMGNSKL